VLVLTVDYGEFPLISILLTGNLHINICADKYDDEIEKVIEPYVYEIVAEERGSISAEHGLGESCTFCVFPLGSRY
jgi:hypothetical protein